MVAKKTKTFRISVEGQGVLDDLTAAFGCDETDLIELGIRLLWGERDKFVKIRDYLVYSAVKYKKKPATPIICKKLKGN